MALTKTERRNRIRNRVRKIVTGSAERPRLSVFRSNKEIYAQLIDDDNATTMAAASSTEKDVSSQEGNKSEKAALVGKLLAKKALDAGIENVVFDRNGYLYHGRVKQLADAAREGGLKF
jgi:large subunit ribosomal protein L18